MKTSNSFGKQDNFQVLLLLLFFPSIGIVAINGFRNCLQEEEKEEEKNEKNIDDDEIERFVVQPAKWMCVLFEILRVHY